MSFYDASNNAMSSAEAIARKKGDRLMFWFFLVKGLVYAIYHAAGKE